MFREPFIRFISMVLLLSVSRSQAAEPIFAAALRPGDTIAIVAPASPVDSVEMKTGKSRLEAMGFHVKFGSSLFAETGYLAGSDEARAADLNAAFRDPDVDAIFAARGGYGTMRILNQLDFDALRQHPKVIIGYSDITALHLAINRVTGLVTFHSPQVESSIGAEKGMTSFSEKYLWRAILADRYLQDRVGYTIAANDAQLETAGRGCHLSMPESMGTGRAEGRLIGGNLSLVSAMVGSPYEIQTDGRILFLEDIGEAPYRVDRMLCTLQLAGKLDNLAGVVLGQFTRRKEEDTSNETTTIDQVLRSYFEPLSVPVIMNFPAGHHDCNATLPIGALCEINADTKQIRVLENPVKP